MKLDEATLNYQKRLVFEALITSKSIAQAAKKLGLKRTTLQMRLASWGYVHDENKKVRCRKTAREMVVCNKCERVIQSGERLKSGDGCLFCRNRQNKRMMSEETIERKKQKIIDVVNSSNTMPEAARKLKISLGKLRQILLLWNIPRPTFHEIQRTTSGTPVWYHEFVDEPVKQEITDKTKTLLYAEAKHVINTIKECGGVKAKAARVLDISIRTLSNKLLRYKGAGLYTELYGDFVERLENIDV